MYKYTCRIPSGFYTEHSAHFNLLFKEKKMNQLTRFDTSPLNRSLIGFDRLFDDFERRFSNNVSYPPYNVLKKGQDNYEVQVAVTGFTREEIVVQVDQEQLVISAKSTKNDVADVEYLHRGLATRDFERRFTLADHMEVVDATVSNGMLSVFLQRIVPETLKPRVIQISQR
jgi:molecular chaperone IbpA